MLWNALELYAYATTIFFTDFPSTTVAVAHMGRHGWFCHTDDMTDASRSVKMLTLYETMFRRCMCNYLAGDVAYFDFIARIMGLTGKRMRKWDCDKTEHN